jgi:hypothetical protein
VFRAAVLSLAAFTLVLNSGAALLCKPLCDGMAARQTANQVACHHADEATSPMLVADNLCNDLALGDAAIISKNDEGLRVSSAVAGQELEFSPAGRATAGVSLRSTLERTFETGPPRTTLRI